MKPQRILLQTAVLSLSVAASSLFAQESTAPAPSEREASPNRWRRVGPDEAQPPSGPPAANNNYNQQQNMPPPQMDRPAPGQIIIPAGTWVTVRTEQLLTSDYNHPGDAFGATLAAPIIADGFVVARRGQTVTGRVTEVIKAGRVKGTSRLGVEINELGIVDGQNVPVRTQLVEFTAGTSRGNDTAIIGTTTGAGAAIGAAAGGGFGAGMGAIAGAGASAIGVLLSRGRTTEVPPESIMRFRLSEAVSVNTERASHAFQPVQQEDYENQGLQQRPTMARRPQQPFYGGGGYYGGSPYYYNPYMWGPGWGYGYGYGWGPSYSLYFGGGRGWYGGRGYYGGGYRGGYRGRR